MLENIWGVCFMAQKKILLEKRQEVLDLFSKGFGYTYISRVTGLPLYTVRKWYYSFQRGDLHWSTMEKAYYCKISLEIKEAAVKDYISGNGSYRSIVAKYGIKQESDLIRWIKNYSTYGIIDRKRGRSRNRPIVYEEQDMPDSIDRNESKSEQELIKEQQIRIAFLENLMHIREENEKSPKKKAHFRHLREQYERAFPPEKSSK